MDELDYIIHAIKRYVEEISSESLREVIIIANEELVRREQLDNARNSSLSKRESYND